MSSTEENGNASALRAPGNPASGPSDVQHTPGPWVGFTDQGHLVAIMPAMRQGEVCGFAVPPSVADGNLMLAAPCLLEALKELLRDEAVLDDGDPRLEASRAQARAALTKAGV